MVKGYRIPSSRYLFNRTFYKDEPEANCSCGFEIKGDVDERVNNENSTC